MLNVKYRPVLCWLCVKEAVDGKNTCVGGPGLTVVSRTQYFLRALHVLYTHIHNCPKCYQGAEQATLQRIDICSLYVTQTSICESCLLLAGGPSSRHPTSLHLFAHVSSRNNNFSALWGLKSNCLAHSSCSINGSYYYSLLFHLTLKIVTENPNFRNLYSVKIRQLENGKSKIHLQVCLTLVQFFKLILFFRTVLGS